MLKQILKSDSLLASGYWLGTRKGFSLLEFLIYISILSVVMLAISGIFISTGQSRGRIDSGSEVTSSLKFASEIIKQDLKVATAITTPLNDATSSSLVITVGGSTVTYALSSGQITRTSAGPTVANLTPTTISVTALTFEQYQNVNLPLLKVLSSVKTTITAEYVSSATEEYSETKQFTVLMGNIFSSPARSGGINGI